MIRSSTPIFWHSSLMLVNRTDDRYRSPKLHRMTTMSLPAISGLVATLRAATTAAPDEMPQKMPSSFAKRFAISIESSLLTCAWPTQAQQQIKRQSHSKATSPVVTEAVMKAAILFAKSADHRQRQRHNRQESSGLQATSKTASAGRQKALQAEKNVTTHGLEQNVLQQGMPQQ